MSVHATAPETVPDLIAAFGGPTRFARIIRKGASTAGEQKRNGSIPVEYWGLIVEAAAEYGVPGVSFETLARMHISAADKAEARA